MSDTSLQRTHPTGMELLAKLSSSVNDPQAAVEIAKQIVELQTRQEELRQKAERFEWEKLDRQARVAYAEAFERFKANCPKILKSKHVSFPTKTGGQTDYWHVELDKACDLLIPALLKEGLTHRWKSTDLPGGMTRVTCFIRHRLGYEEEGASLAGPADQSGGKNPIQGVGSSTSYLERYTFLATCGIVPTGIDDDGGQPTIQGFDELLQDIQGSVNAQDLRDAHVKALKAAMREFDKIAGDAFNEAKNKRLGEINRGEI